MRIDLISDIHANLVALDAVLAEIATRQLDQVVCLGDVAAGGPQPHETMTRLRELNLPVVLGNTDAWCLDRQPFQSTDDHMRRIAEIEHWCAEQLSPDDLAYLRTFKPVVEIPLDDSGTLLCFHGSPRSYDDVIVSTTSEDDLDRMLAGFTADLMAGGHTHAQMLRRHKNMIILNPGSVGLPFVRGFAERRHPAWAEYASVDLQGRGLSVQFRRVPLDVRAIAEAAREHQMPHADWWSQGWR